jgi:hypothetical protein
MNSKECISQELFNTLTPNNSISIAINEKFDILAIDNWIEYYKEDYESVGQYNIFKKISKQTFPELIKKDIEKITYQDIYELNILLVKRLLKI